MNVLETLGHFDVSIFQISFGYCYRALISIPESSSANAISVTILEDINPHHMVQGTSQFKKSRAEGVSYPQGRRSTLGAGKRSYIVLFVSVLMLSRGHCCAKGGEGGGDAPLTAEKYYYRYFFEKFEVYDGDSRVGMS
jgi:hypothetical protein